MHASHTCLRSLQDANAWLEGQSTPLAPPGDETDGAWQRRLVEAAFWYAKDALVRRAQAWATDHAYMTPDINDGEAAVYLNVHRTRQDPNAPSTKDYVRPSLRGRPLQAVVPNKKLSVDLILPASSLEMPQALWEAFDQGALACAIGEQCEGLFWVPLNIDMLQHLGARWDSNHVWTQEIQAAQLQDRWTVSPDKRTTPRF